MNNKRPAIWATVAVLCFIAIYMSTRGRIGNYEFCSNQTNTSTWQPLEGYSLITMLSIFNGQRWEHYPNFTPEELQERDEEYIQTLQANAENKMIKEIHLFYTDEGNLKVLNERNLTNREKIIPVKRKRLVHMADFFLYASEELLDKPVIVTNADISRCQEKTTLNLGQLKYFQFLADCCTLNPSIFAPEMRLASKYVLVIGEGFEKVNTTLLRDKKVMHSLSRHDFKSCPNYDQCTSYVGSHDTHVLRLKEPLNAAILLDRLDYRINLWRAENGLIATMKYKFNFKVYNPCHFLMTYHHHCSKVHGNTDEATNSVDHLPGAKWSRSQLGKSVAEPQRCLLY